MATDELWQEIIEASLFPVAYYIALNINVLVMYSKTRVTSNFITTPGHYPPFTEKPLLTRLRLGGLSISLETGLSTKNARVIMTSVWSRRRRARRTLSLRRLSSF